VITIHYHNRRINICNSPLLKTIQCLTSNNNSKLLVCKFKNIEIKHTFIALLTLTMKLQQLPCSLELLEYLTNQKNNRTSKPIQEDKFTFTSHEQSTNFNNKLSFNFTFSEISLEPAWQVTEVLHSASSSGLSANSLLTPVI